MADIVVTGGLPLCGDVSISGAKNAVLPILAATLLTEDRVTIRNVARLKDVKPMDILLKSLGAHVTHAGGGRPAPDGRWRVW